MYIEMKNAVKKYGTGEALVYALDHADFELEKGEMKHFLDSYLILLV